MQCFVKKLIIKFLGKRERERVAVIPAQAGIQSFLNSGFRLLGRNDRAFTLIELLVVIAILSILATVVLLVINPAQMFKQSRDATRISDMETISKAILVFQSSGTSALSMGSSNTIYVSVPAVNSNCSDLNLSAPPSGWAYACSTSANNRKTNGTGWIPIDFSSSPFGSLLATLPIDPSNATSTGLYYTYINGSFALSATLESTKYLASSAANDKGQSATRFEMGSNLALNVNLLAAATAPTNIVLEIGSTAPVGGVTNVAIPATGATDTTGAVTGWVTTTADKIKFTVTDGGSAVSTITIGGAAYTSGADYAIPSTASLSIVVTTTESGKTTGVRTFTVTVAAYAIPTNGLVGYWKFDETSGTSATDSSGNSNTGTLTGGPTWTTSGKIGGALSFDGVNDYVINSSPTGLPTGNNSITITAWFKVPSSTTGVGYLVLSGTKTTRGGYHVLINHDAIGRVFSGYFGVGFQMGVTGMNDGTWRYFAGTYDGVTHRTYINGTAYSTLVEPGTGVLSGAQYIFGASSATTEFLTGTMDEVAIYNRALSAAEVLAIYNGQN